MQSKSRKMLSELEDTEDNDSTDVQASKVLELVLKRVERKSVAARADIYKNLFMKSFKAAIDAPQARRELLPLLKQFNRDGAID